MRSCRIRRERNRIQMRMRRQKLRQSAELVTVERQREKVRKSAERKKLSAELAAAEKLRQRARMSDRRQKLSVELAAAEKLRQKARMSDRRQKLSAADRLRDKVRKSAERKKLSDELAAADRLRDKVRKSAERKKLSAELAAADRLRDKVRKSAERKKLSAELAAADRLRDKVRKSAERKKLSAELAAADRLRDKVRKSAERKKLSAELAAADRLREKVRKSAERKKLSAELAAADRLREKVRKSAERKKLSAELAAAEKLRQKARMSDRRQRLSAADRLREKVRKSAERKKLSAELAAAEKLRQKYRMSDLRRNMSFAHRQLDTVTRSCRRRQLFPDRQSQQPVDCDDGDMEQACADAEPKRSVVGSFDIFGSGDDRTARMKATDCFQNALYAYDYPPMACSVCMEFYPVLNPRKHLNEDGVCPRCTYAYNRSGMLKFSKENGMDPGQIVPKELKDLSNLEEMLIASVMPIMAVYNLPHGQRAYRGHVICFPQDVKSFADAIPLKRLPRSLQDVDILVVRKRDSMNTHTDFRVRRSRVESALNWLKEHNPYYSDIELDAAALNALPEDGNVRPGQEVMDEVGEVDQPVEITETSDQETDICNDPDTLLEEHEYEEQVQDTASYVPQCIRTRRHGDVVEHEVAQIDDGHNVCFGANEENEREVVDWPEQGEEAIAEFGTVGYIVRAFPTLFPYGQAGLWADRELPVTPKEYFKHLMLYRDPRFAQHDRFRYFAENSVRRWECLQKGSLFIKQNPEDAMLTVEQVRQMAQNDKRDLINRMTHTAKSIRGTDKWWNTRKGELLSMCDQLSTLPAVFFTLSSADMQWPDLHRLMPAEHKGNRGLAVRKNPLICVRYFQFRVKQFLSTVMKSFGMVEHWGRFEFQHRGSVHFHGIAWLNDSPDVFAEMQKGDEGEKKCVTYFDNIISAWNPALPDDGGNLPQLSREHAACRVYHDIPNDEAVEDYIELISRVQRHTRCMRNYCLTKRDENGDLTCRFGFPIDLLKESKMTRIKRDKQDDEFEFVPRRNDRLLNTHNPAQLFGWRANSDMSAITDRYAVATYILKYASKGEKQSKDWSQVASGILQKVHSQTSLKTIARKLLISKIDRDYSAQETVMLLMGDEFVSSSRSFEYVSLQSRQWNSQECVPNGIDKYVAARQQFPQLRDVCLFDFFKSYYVKKANGRHTLVTRRKDKIVLPRPYQKPCGRESERYEDFCKHYLILYKPFDDSNEIYGDENVRNTFEAFVLLHPISDRAISRALEGLGDVQGQDSVRHVDDTDGQEMNEEPWMLACRRVLPKQAEENAAVFQNYDWREYYLSLPEEVQVSLAPGTNWLQTQKNTVVLPGRPRGDADSSKLNEQQKRVYDFFVDLKRNLTGE